MRISDWSSDVCSSDLLGEDHARRAAPLGRGAETHAHGRLKRESPAPARPARRVDVDAPRSEERRVGKECVSTRKSRWAPYHSKKKNNTNTNTNASEYFQRPILLQPTAPTTHKR